MTTTDRPYLAKALADIAAERARQERLKAEGRFKFTAADPEMSDLETYAVLGEEFGEAGRALLERARLANDTHDVNLRKELVQVAAVCAAWIEKLDRQAAPVRQANDDTL